MEIVAIQLASCGGIESGSLLTGNSRIRSPHGGSTCRSVEPVDHKFVAGRDAGGKVKKSRSRMVLHHLCAVTRNYAVNQPGRKG